MRQLIDLLQEPPQFLARCAGVAQLKLQRVAHLNMIRHGNRPLAGVDAGQVTDKKIAGTKFLAHLIVNEADKDGALLRQFPVFRRKR